MLQRQDLGKEKFNRGDLKEMQELLCNKPSPVEFV